VNFDHIIAKDIVSPTNKAAPSPPSLGHTCEPVPGALSHEEDDIRDLLARSELQTSNASNHPKQFTHSAIVVILTAHSGTVIHVTDTIRCIFPDATPCDLVGKPVSDVLTLSDWQPSGSPMCRMVTSVIPHEACEFKPAERIAIKGCVVTPLLGLVRWSRAGADANGGRPFAQAAGLMMRGIGGDNDHVSVPFIGTAITFAVWHVNDQHAAWDHVSLAALCRRSFDAPKEPSNADTAADNHAGDAPSAAVAIDVDEPTRNPLAGPMPPLPESAAPLTRPSNPSRQANSRQSRNPAIVDNAAASTPQQRPLSLDLELPGMQSLPEESTGTLATPFGGEGARVNHGSPTHVDRALKRLGHVPMTLAEARETKARVGAETGAMRMNPFDDALSTTAFAFEMRTHHLLRHAIMWVSHGSTASRSTSFLFASSSHHYGGGPSAASASGISTLREMLLTAGFTVSLTPFLSKDEVAALEASGGFGGGGTGDDENTPRHGPGRTGARFSSASSPRQRRRSLSGGARSVRRSNASAASPRGHGDNTARGHVSTHSADTEMTALTTPSHPALAPMAGHAALLSMSNPSPLAAAPTAVLPPGAAPVSAMRRNSGPGLLGGSGGSGGGGHPYAMERHSQSFKAFITKLRVALFSAFGEHAWLTNNPGAAPKAHSVVPPLVFMTSDSCPEELEVVPTRFPHAFFCILLPPDANREQQQQQQQQPLTSIATSGTLPGGRAGPEAANIVYLSVLASDTLLELMTLAVRYYRQLASESRFAFDMTQEGFWRDDTAAFDLTKPPPRSTNNPTTPRHASSSSNAALAAGSDALSPLRAYAPLSSLTDGAATHHARHSTGVGAVVATPSPETQFQQVAIRNVHSDTVEMEMLGQGAFASVFRMKVAPFSSDIALKRIELYADKDRRDWRNGSEQEYRALLRRQRTSDYETEYGHYMMLDHPNICRTYFAHIYDTEDNATTRADIYLEYCNGGTITQMFRGLPTADQILEITRGALRGLAHLHRLSICHLDIKPENIMLRDGVAKICDFGTARRLRQGYAEGGPEKGPSSTWRLRSY
jgi:hypothetical protein